MLSKIQVVFFGKVSKVAKRFFGLFSLVDDLISVSKNDLLNMGYLYFIGAAEVEISSGNRESPERFSDFPDEKHEEPSCSKTNILYIKNFISQPISYI